MSEKYVIREIPLDSIRFEGQEIRVDPDDESIIELAADITRRGLLQLPGVEPTENGFYQLIWGRRRCTAFLRLRRKTIPCRIYETGDDSIRTVALVENLQRRNLTLDEEIQAVTYLHHAEHLSPNEIAVRLSKGRDWVLRRLSIPNMPEEIREPLLEGRLSIAAAEEICTLEDAGARRYTTAHCTANKLSLSQVREMVAALKAAAPDQEAVEAGVAAATQPHNDTRIFLECGACGSRREPHELRIVRVCAEGCQQELPLNLTQEN